MSDYSYKYPTIYTPLILELFDTKLEYGGPWPLENLDIRYSTRFSNM